MLHFCLGSTFLRCQRSIPEFQKNSTHSTNNHGCPLLSPQPHHQSPATRIKPQTDQLEKGRAAQGLKRTVSSKDEESPNVASGALDSVIVNNIGENENNGSIVSQPEPEQHNNDASQITDKNVWPTLTMFEGEICCGVTYQFTKKCEYYGHCATDIVDLSGAFCVHWLMCSSRRKSLGMCTACPMIHWQWFCQQRTSHGQWQQSIRRVSLMQHTEAKCLLWQRCHLTGVLLLLLLCHSKILMSWERVMCQHTVCHDLKQRHLLNLKISHTSSELIHP